MSMLRPSKAVVAFNIEEEKAELEVLMENLKNTNSLTERMSSMLTVFDTRLGKLEESIRPIYRTTQNVDATIACVDRTRQYFNIIPVEEEILRRGTQGDIKGFVASIERLHYALVQLQKTNFRSSSRAIASIQQLLRQGLTTLDETYAVLLMDVSFSIEPLAYITKGIFSKNEFPTIPAQSIGDLRLLSQFLSNFKFEIDQVPVTSNILKIYSDKRGAYLQQSLTSLAQASVNTAQRVGNTFYDKGANGIYMYMKAFAAMVKIELSIASNFFGEKRNEPLKVALRPSVVELAKTVTILNQYVIAHPLTDSFLAYDVVGEVGTLLNGPCGDIIRNTGGSELDEALKGIRHTALATFSGTLDAIQKRVASMVNLPADGGICDLTTECTARLRRLADYPDAISSLLISLGDGGWHRTSAGIQSSSKFDVGANASAIFAHFISDICELAACQLDGKAKASSKKPSVIGIFCMNNLNYMITRISELDPKIFGEGLQKLEVAKKKSTNLYLDSWKTCAEHLMDVTYVKGGLGGSVRNSMGTKEKEAIKDKFRNFNMELEENMKSHRAFVISDDSLRASLIADVKKMVVPLYLRFYDKYQASDFTKNLTKYIKYDKTQLENTLSTLFESPTTL
ncbi:Exocyst complex protein exo70 [Neolecta irregularis DAH-3]|uniref:Exocyst complex protein EXO70 n=1 Tax=Neolecta irregularis (strain DAH-3) TaxID=1198029 RepID=A0A1U7LUQ0_NEOID|nr:Exocyst complex protein exo70 [Neolecta irregularis DAH-3]|eukprot:OLL26387.1 Exocyst complex protein exo70 [Neolecta irregularis DAH-3]